MPRKGYYREPDKVLPTQDPRFPHKDHFEPYITQDSPRNGMRRCQGWKKDRSGQCGNVATKGFDVCKRCGSSGGRPITTGEHSKYLPKQADMDKAMADLLADPELTGLQEQIASVKFRQDTVFAEIRALLANQQEAGHKWKEYDAYTEQLIPLTVAENKRQAQLASNMNARQANALKTVLIAVLIDVLKDESIPRSQIAKVVGLKLVQKMS